MFRLDCLPAIQTSAQLSVTMGSLTLRITLGTKGRARTSPSPYSPNARRLTNVSLMDKGITWAALYWQTRVSQQTERPFVGNRPNSSGRNPDAIPLAGEIKVSAGAIDKQVRELGCGGSFYAERMLNVPDVLPINGDAAA